MYSTRGALALLWRAGIGDQSGTRLWSPDENDAGNALQQGGLGEVVVRQEPQDGRMVQVTVFCVNERGFNVWQRVLRAVQMAVEGDSLEWMPTEAEPRGDV